MKKVGILGSGAVGKMLGNGFLKNGYQVMIGSRDTEKLSEWKRIGGENAFVGSSEEAAKFGDLIVLAVKGEAAMEVIHSAGPENLKGKTIIDTTNPIDHTRAAENGILALFTAPNDSLMEQIQRALPDSNIVKSFNCVGNGYMVEPKFPQGRPTMFICGNSEAAKAEVVEILELFGWDSEDIGKVEGARAIEPLVVLWCAPGFLRNQWNHAFALYKM